MNFLQSHMTSLFLYDALEKYPFLPRNSGQMNNCNTNAFFLNSYLKCQGFSIHKSDHPTIDGSIISKISSKCDFEIWVKLIYNPSVVLRSF